jgi:adenylate cyclase class 2
MKSRKEIEAKFIVSDLDTIRRRLQNLGGRVVTPKHSELNLYFDTPDRKLLSGKQVLRIRTDAEVRLTYKRQEEAFEDRTEIELTLDDAVEARALLEALGFDLVFTYEKRREAFGLTDVLVTLDELPFGHFVEVEGESLDDIRNASAGLGLDWQKRVQISYMALFDRLREDLKLATTEASFDAFSNLPPLRAEDLDLVYATQTVKHGGNAS